MKGDFLPMNSFFLFAFAFAYLALSNHPDSAGNLKVPILNTFSPTLPFFRLEKANIKAYKRNIIAHGKRLADIIWNPATSLAFCNINIITSER